MRWDPYILSHGDAFDKFWSRHLRCGSRRVLFVVGRGFDVRATDACERIIDSGGTQSCDVWVICYDNGLPESIERAEMTGRNTNKISQLFIGGNVHNLAVELGGVGQQAATSRNAARALSSAGTLSDYSDVIVDISAMPRMIAMTAIAKLTRVLDDLAKNKGVHVNLHVTTSESIETDRSATGGSLSDTVTNVVGFSGRLNGEVDDHIPRIWFPILGENQSERLSLIREELRPDEICPVIPFPSREARRGDEIVDSYRQLLFDDFQVEPRNILHACEFNPFEAYKQLYGAIDRYKDAMKGLGGCKVFVSPLSSKLLSVGALLACYDHIDRDRTDGKLFVGIPYVESATYGEPNQDGKGARELYTMWIRGEWEE